MGDRCTGHCCKAFQLAYGIDDVKLRAGGLEDGAFIADMLIPLYSGPLGEMPAELRAITDMRDDDAPESVKHVYTCRHFDGSQCQSYESRPAMCRRYPYGRRCEFKGCEWKAAREGRTSVSGGDEAVEFGVSPLDGVVTAMANLATCQAANAEMMRRGALADDRRKAWASRAEEC